MTTTKIQWAGHVWNPVVGCSIASHGCNGCYAMAMAHRLERIEIAHQADYGEPGGLQHYLGLTHKASRPGAKAVWTGKVASAPDAIWHQPLRRKKPTRYFVNSMGDLFHPDVPDEWRDRAFAVMAQCPQHTFMVLTKRPDLMRKYLSRHRWPVWAGLMRTLRMQFPKLRTPTIIGGDCTPVPNVWLGVSTEDQAQADARIPPLLATPAAKRFISAEPLLGPIDLTRLRPPSVTWLDALEGREHDGPSICRVNALDWVICGGESGPNARPMHPDWARSLRDQCALTGVPFFFKQWGEWLPSMEMLPKAKGWRVLPDGQGMSRIGTKRAGNMLDGRQHLELPQ